MTKQSTTRSARSSTPPPAPNNERRPSSNSGNTMTSATILDAELFVGIDFVTPSMTTTDVTTIPSTDNIIPRLSIRKNKKFKKTHSGILSKSHIRGVGTLRKLSDFVKENGRIPLTWDSTSNVPYYPKKGKQSLSWDIGTIVRSHVPMTKPYYKQHDVDARKIVINQLSVYYDIDPQDNNLHQHIQGVAASVYRQYKNSCYRVFQEQNGKYPVPEEFKDKESEWISLCEHFEDPKFIKKSKEMTKSRNSINKKNHKAGPTAFVIKARTFANNPAPLMQAYIEAYKDTDSDRSILAANLVKKTVTEMRTEHGIEEELPESIDVHISIERQIELMGEVVGPSKGTRLRGFGGVHLKEPKVRGLGVVAPPQDSSLLERLAQFEARFEEQQVQLNNTIRKFEELQEKHSNENV